MKTDISVIVVNWNGKKFLKRCLDALGSQTLAPREIILVDNASEDGSPEWVRQHYPRVRLLAMEDNLGFARANNLAAGEARGDWLALLNPDAFPEPGWLAAFHSAIQSNPDTASFTGKLVMAEHPDRLDGTGDIYHVSGLAWRRDHGRSNSRQGRAFGPVFSACGASALYRRDLFLALDGFDEDFFCYMEDVDLGFRLRLRGEQCLYVPDAVALHLGSASTGLRSDFATYHGQRNLVWVFYKNMPAPLFWAYLPLHLGLNLVSLAWLATRGQAGSAFRAKRDALRKLGAMGAKRRVIQENISLAPWTLRRQLARGLSLIRR